MSSEESDTGQNALLRARDGKGGKWDKGDDANDRKPKKFTKIPNVPGFPGFRASWEAPCRFSVPKHVLRATPV
jgi:hypothetical protein